MVLDRDKFLSESEVKKLLLTTKKLAHNGNKSWKRRWMTLDLLLNTGCRLSEVRLLRNKDINLEGSATITVIGKGKKVRTIPIINKDLKKHLKGYFRLKEKWEEDASPESHFLLSSWGKPYTIAGFQKNFRMCCSEAGLRSVYKTHSTRHSFGMRTYQKSKNLKLVQTLLGHSSIVSTGIYIHYSEKEMTDTLKDLWS